MQIKRSRVTIRNISEEVCIYYSSTYKKLLNPTKINFYSESHPDWCEVRIFPVPNSEGKFIDNYIITIQDYIESHNNIKPDDLVFNYYDSAIMTLKGVIAYLIYYLEQNGRSGIT